MVAVAEDVRTEKAVVGERPAKTFTLPRRDAAVIPDSSLVPERYHEPLIEQRNFLINGRLRVWDGPMKESHSAIPVHDESGNVTYPLIGRYPSLDEKTAIEVLGSAHSAFARGRSAWATSPELRVRAVSKFLDLLQKERDRVAIRESREIAKSEKDSFKEFDRTIEYGRVSIDEFEALQAEEKALRKVLGTTARVGRAPLGVALCCGPSNYPLNETLTLLIPALLMGNTVVFKPPRVGVLLFEPLLKALAESFPPGVVNVVYGDGEKVLTPAMQDGRVNLLAFIGSARVANFLIKAHKNPCALRLVLGLGAKNPGIILPGADLDKAADECVLGALSFNGQRCTALKILMVHESVADEFAKKVAERVAKLRQGMPWAPGVEITPLSEPGKVGYFKELIADAELHGAKVINPGGGEAVANLFTPAVLYPVSPASRLYREEQFGPVVPISTYRNLSEVLEYLEGSEVGQQLSIFGKDAKTIREFAHAAKNLVCRRNVNTQSQRGPDNFPFSGRESAGQGTLSYRDALLAFSTDAMLAGSSEDALLEQVFEAA